MRGIEINTGPDRRDERIRDLETQLEGWMTRVKASAAAIGRVEWLIAGGGTFTREQIRAALDGPSTAGPPTTP